MKIRIQRNFDGYCIGETDKVTYIAQTPEGIGRLFTDHMRELGYRGEQRLKIQRDKSFSDWDIERFTDILKSTGA